jgi:hypothetical protein
MAVYMHKVFKPVGQLEATADLLDGSKQMKHAGHPQPGHTFVPASLETYGCRTGNKRMTEIINSKVGIMPDAWWRNA